MKHIFYTISFILFIAFNFTACGSDNSRSTPNYYTFNDSDSIYETAEDGSVDKWQTWAGFESYDHIENVDIGANGSDRSIFIRNEWIDDFTNISNFKLPLNNDYQFILELDQMKKHAENKHCFIVGVHLDTEWGTRYISFSTYFALEMRTPSIQTYENGIKEMNFPLDMKYVDQTNVWQHMRFNLTDYLHQFEPGNNILNVEAFTFQGGDDYLDNIRLVSE